MAGEVGEQVQRVRPGGAPPGQDGEVQIAFRVEAALGGRAEEVNRLDLRISPEHLSQPARIREGHRLCHRSPLVFLRTEL
jgi:hypothetical protein